MKTLGFGMIGLVVCFLSFFGNQVFADEKEEKAAQVVRSYFLEALDGRQPERVYSLFAQDAVQIFNGYLKNEGIEAVFKNTEGAKKIFSEFHTEIHDLTVKGPIVYAFITHTATYVDSTAPGFPTGPVRVPTRVGPLTLKGQQVQWQAMARFELNAEGKIQKEWIVRDELGSLLTSGTLRCTNF